METPEMPRKPRENRGVLDDWARKDSNLRRHKPSDLQSDPVGHLGTRPGVGQLRRVKYMAVEMLFKGRRGQRGVAIRSRPHGVLGSPRSMMLRAGDTETFPQGGFSRRCSGIPCGDGG